MFRAMVAAYVLLGAWLLYGCSAPAAGFPTIGSSMLPSRPLPLAHSPPSPTKNQVRVEQPAVRPAKRARKQQPLDQAIAVPVVVTTKISARRALHTSVVPAITARVLEKAPVPVPKRNKTTGKGEAAKGASFKKPQPNQRPKSSPIKAPLAKTDPPPDFADVWEVITALRETRDAPVDAHGAEILGDWVPPGAPPRTEDEYQFTVMVALMLSSQVKAHHAVNSHGSRSHRAHRGSLYPLEHLHLYSIYGYCICLFGYLPTDRGSF